METNNTSSLTTLRYIITSENRELNFTPSVATLKNQQMPYGKLTKVLDTLIYKL